MDGNAASISFRKEVHNVLQASAIVVFPILIHAKSLGKKI
jgi:hypothetical protein